MVSFLNSPWLCSHCRHLRECCKYNVGFVERSWNHLLAAVMLTNMSLFLLAWLLSTILSCHRYDMTCSHPFSFPRRFTHTFVHTQTPISITHTCAAGTSHTLVFWYFSGIREAMSCGVSPVEECMFCLWSVTCTSTVGLKWMWALSQKISTDCVSVCVYGGVSWLVGRHQYRWGIQKWWMSWLGLLLSSWVSIKKSLTATVQTKPEQPIGHTDVPLCLLRDTHWYYTGIERKPML